MADIDKEYIKRLKIIPYFDLANLKKELLDISDAIQEELGDSFKKVKAETKKKKEETQKEETSKWKTTISSIGNYFKDVAKQTFKKIGEDVGEYFKQVFESAIETLDEVASYNLGTSLSINSDARNQMLQYGLTEAQNYAFAKVKEEMGISSEEDLFYMNEAQQERFAERIGYYSDKYDSLNQSGFLQEWQNYQIEMKEFKEEMIMDVAQFLVDNKEPIQKFMQAGLSFMKTVVEILGWFTKNLGDGQRSESSRFNTTSDIIASHSVSNSSNVNVNQTNNFNGENSSNRNLANVISNLNSKAFPQIIKSLGGR